MGEVRDGEEEEGREGELAQEGHSLTCFSPSQTPVQNRSQLLSGWSQLLCRQGGSPQSRPSTGERWTPSPWSLAVHSCSGPMSIPYHLWRGRQKQDCLGHRTFRVNVL